MSIFETIIIAIVEGLTEFLPVSSTGHMIIAQNLLGVESTEFVKAFTFIIQFGAILSVVVLARCIHPCRCVGIALQRCHRCNARKRYCSGRHADFRRYLHALLRQDIQQRKRKDTIYRKTCLHDWFVPMHLDDSRCIPLHGYHCWGYVTRLDP